MPVRPAPTLYNTSDMLSIGIFLRRKRAFLVRAYASGMDQLRIAPDSVLMVLGVLLIGAANYLLNGVAWTLFYAGAVCVIWALVLAMVAASDGRDSP